MENPPYPQYWRVRWNFQSTYYMKHGLRTPREEIAFTARPKIQSQSQIFRYCGSIFCLPHRPNFSDIFDLCLHWVSVVRDFIPVIWKDFFFNFIVFLTKFDWIARSDTSRQQISQPNIKLLAWFFESLVLWWNSPQKIGYPSIFAL
jgi:hypothetical protein